MNQHDRVRICANSMSNMHLCWFLNSYVTKWKIRKIYQIKIFFRSDAIHVQQLSMTRIELKCARLKRLCRKQTKNARKRLRFMLRWSALNWNQCHTFSTLTLVYVWWHLCSFGKFWITKIEAVLIWYKTAQNSIIIFCNFPRTLHWTTWHLPLFSTRLSK